MNEAPRPVHVGHRNRLAKTLGTLALVALLASATFACSAPSLGKPSSAGHSCADKIAQAAVVGSVPGLWNCLSPKVQNDLQVMGVKAGDGALVPKPFALTSVLVGSTSDEATYEQTLTPAAYQQDGFHRQVVVIWLDSAGKVTGIETGPSPN